MNKINRVLPIENFKLVLEYSDGVSIVEIVLFIHGLKL
jgi:hypothetical protein